MTRKHCLHNSSSFTTLSYKIVRYNFHECIRICWTRQWRITLYCMGACGIHGFMCSNNETFLPRFYKALTRKSWRNSSLLLVVVNELWTNESCHNDSCLKDKPTSNEKTCLQDFLPITTSDEWLSWQHSYCHLLTTH